MSFAIRVLAIGASLKDLAWLKAQEEALAELHLSIEYSDEISVAHTNGFNIMLLDNSLSAQTIRTLLADAMLAEHQLPVLIALTKDELVPNEHLIRYGAQDFILKNLDSPPTIRRCVVNAMDRFKVLRATEEAEAQIRSLIESLTEGILIIDTRGFILFANPMTEQLLGTPLSDLYGLKTPFKVTEKEVEHVFWERPEGPPVTLSVQTSSIRWDGMDANLLILRDVTTEQASYELLKAARKAAEKAAAMKSAFLANMSHELRLPLASIIGFAQLIEEGDSNPDFKEFAALIQESGQRLLETINAVLEATRLDQHTLIPSFTDVDISEVIPSVVRRLQPLVRQPDVVLSTEGPPSVFVRADINFLERILNNLVGNAAKFTEKGSIQAKWSSSRDMAIIEVIDTGVGIGESFLEEAFEAFTQESSGSTRSHDGTGLGLSIAKKLVEMMGGSITVKSSKNKGTTFTFSLPLAAKTPTS